MRPFVYIINKYNIIHTLYKYYILLFSFILLISFTFFINIVVLCNSFNPPHALLFEYKFIKLYYTHIFNYNLYANCSLI